MGVENLPEHLSWQDLKEFGAHYGSSLTFARTYTDDLGICCGVLEYQEREDAAWAMHELSGMSLAGSTPPLCTKRADRMQSVVVPNKRKESSGKGPSCAETSKRSRRR